MMPVVDVVVTFLEMGRNERPAAVRPLPREASLCREPRQTAPAVAAALYRRVGGPWHWLDRLRWGDDDWRHAIDRDDVEVWTVRVGDEIAGYFELAANGDAVDIHYFGLAPGWTGRGIGGPLLEHAIARAWSLEPRRVTVNTCTLDHPAALPNYRARGFRVLRTERQRRRIP